MISISTAGKLPVTIIGTEPVLMKPCLTPAGASTVSFALTGNRSSPSTPRPSPAAISIASSTLWWWTRTAAPGAIVRYDNEIAPAPVSRLTISWRVTPGYGSATLRSLWRINPTLDSIRRLVAALTPSFAGSQSSLAQPTKPGRIDGRAARPAPVSDDLIGERPARTVGRFQIKGKLEQNPLKIAGRGIGLDHSVQQPMVQPIDRAVGLVAHSALAAGRQLGKLTLLARAEVRFGHDLPAPSTRSRFRV